MTFAISILLKGTFMACAVLLCLFLLKKSAATTRHWLASLGLLGLLVLPLFQMFTPSVAVEMPIVEALPDLENIATLPIMKPTVSTLTVEMETSNCTTIPPSEALIDVTDSANTSRFNLPFALLWSELLLGVYLFGLAFFLLKLCLGLIGIWRITKQAVPHSLPFSYQKLLKLRRNIHLLESVAIQTPMTWGFFHPTILLPTANRTWTEEETRVIVLHELAHIKRNDYALHLLGMLTICLYWWHPLVWLLQIWQQAEREKACDEYVLRLGVSKTYYAEQLVQVAHQIAQPRNKNWRVGLPMAQASSTKERVLAILQFDASRRRFSAWIQWRWLGIFACSLPLLAAVHPSGRSLIEEQIPTLEAALEQPVFEVVLAEDVPLEIESIQFLPKKQTQIAVPVHSLDWKDILTKKTSRMPTLKAVPTLAKKPLLLTMSTQQSLTTAARRETLPRYGTWKSAAAERVQVWTKGTFDISETAPFFTKLSEDALIIIEIETAAQKRTLMINKAAYSSKTYSDPKRKNRSMIKKGETVFHWLVDDMFYSSMAYTEKSGFKNYVTQNLPKDMQLTFTDTSSLGVRFPDITIPLSAIHEADWESDELPDWAIALQIAKAEGFKGDNLSVETAIQLLGNVPIKTWDDYPNWASRLNAEIAPIARKMLAISEADTWQTIRSDYPLAHWETMMMAANRDLTHRLEPITKEHRLVQEKMLKEQQKIAWRTAKKRKKESLKLAETYSLIPSGFLYLSPNRKRIMPTFFMSSTEVSNLNYREFLADMQGKMKSDTWETIQIKNENWNAISEMAYKEPLVQTYHQHPAYDEYPVVNISYEGARAYCDWLGEQLQAQYANEWKIEVRLPTKEEWMYAARGGHILAPYPWGGYYLLNTEGLPLCNFRRVGEDRIKYNASTKEYEVLGHFYKYTGSLTPIKSYFPNAYGLYNMCGNAAEMLWEKGSTKGGSWNSTGYYVRIEAEDEYADWSDASPFIGFRPLVMVEKL